jgi:hypothetical protein
MLCDTPPPPSPGNSQVNAWAKIIKEAAQVKAAAERKVGTALAAHRRPISSLVLWEISFD